MPPRPSKFRIGRSRTGLGLFATQAIPKRTLIVEYSGRLIPTAKAQELERRHGSKYMFELNRRWTIDGSSRRNMGRYVNHSCDPNAEAESVRGRLMYRAVKKIAAGEEITIDYGEEYMALYLARTGCKCRVCTPAV